MKPSLDAMLEAYRQRPIPAVPPNLKQNVWRTIRLEAEKSRRSTWCGIWDWLEDRRFVTAALSSAVAIGMLFSLFPQPISTNKAMGLEVFSHRSYSSLARLAENP